VDDFSTVVRDNVMIGGSGIKEAMAEEFAD
jgi:hypothetical protein